MWMLAPALGWHGRNRPFEDLQQGLLHPFTGDIASDGRVFRLAGDLVDLVDVDDPLFRALDVEVGGLDQLEQYVLHVLTDIAGFGEGSGVGDGEWDVEHPGQRLCQEGLAGTGGADEQDIGLLQLDVFFGRPLSCAYSFVVVVDRNREDLLGQLLADDVLTEEVEDLVGLGELGK